MARCKVCFKCLINMAYPGAVWVDCLPLSHCSGMVWGCDNGTAHSESHWCEPWLDCWYALGSTALRVLDGFWFYEPTGGSAWWVERLWAVSTWRKRQWVLSCIMGVLPRTKMISLVRRMIVSWNQIISARMYLKVLDMGGQGRQNALYI